MFQAAFWGFVGGASLLIGALVGLFLSVPIRLVGLVMGFGVGVLISAVAFELTGAAYERAGAVPVVIGLTAGALTFFVGDWVIDRMGAENRKDPTGTAAGAGASASTSLVLGALLDGIPESAAIGVSLLGGGSVGTAVVIAVFLSNIPESLSASAGMKRDGRSVGYVLRLWVLVVVASTVAAAGLRAARQRGGDDAGRDRGLRRWRSADDARRHDGAGGRRARRSCGRPGLCRRLHLLVSLVNGRRGVTRERAGRARSAHRADDVGNPCKLDRREQAQRSSAALRARRATISGVGAWSCRDAWLCAGCGGDNESRPPSRCASPAMTATA
ncbi:MAG: ZIP family metal transporter [Mycobacteriales bacterium]